ncbi:phosphodiesterase [Thermoplasmatales archaeon]|nr:phosphodiesterase [Thermoplasmatales archaeon]
MKFLIISDAHSNYSALRAAVDSEKYDKLIFLGDAVDYGPQPVEVLDFITENADYSVMGNHDRAVAYNEDCNCSIDMHDLSEYTRREISGKLLSKQDIDKLKKMPERITVNLDGIKTLMTHASPYNSLNGYMYGSEADMVARDKNLMEYSLIMVGHTHYPMYFKSRIINPGSVGQPRDGNWRPHYATLDTDSMKVEFRRFKYDHEKTLKLLTDIVTDEAMLQKLAKFYS